MAPGEARTVKATPTHRIVDETRSERVLDVCCAACGGTFTPVRPHQKHCRPSCRRAA
jgi:hypothetical protein